jgi:hypothetical protein
VEEKAESGKLKPESGALVGAFLVHAEVSGSFVAECVGFLDDGEPAGFQLGFDLAKDRGVAERIPCPGSTWCRDRKEILAADGLGSAVKQHSSRRSLGAGLRVFDDVHRFCVETTKAEDIAAPGLCLASVRV